MTALTQAPARRAGASPVRRPAPARPEPPPVEYGEAVSRYLSEAGLRQGSRRVYLISLTGWAWPLVGRPIPQGSERRRAVPPSPGASSRRRSGPS